MAKLSDIARAMARGARIPPELIPSVVERALATHFATEELRPYLRGRARRSPPLRELVARVVARAIEDHRAGLLARVCNEPPREVLDLRRKAHARLGQKKRHF